MIDYPIGTILSYIKRQYTSNILYWFDPTTWLKDTKRTISSLLALPSAIFRGIFFIFYNWYKILHIRKYPVSIFFSLIGWGRSLFQFNETFFVMDYVKPLSMDDNF